MTTIKQMDKKQTEFISNLTSDALKEYIDNITRQYYLHLSNNESGKVRSIIDLLNKIVELHGKSNVQSYINYSLINSFNEVLFKSVEFDSDINLIDIKEPVSNKVADKDFFSESQLEKVVKYFESQKAFKYCEDLKKKLKTDDDIKQYFHYEDYIV